MDNLVMKPKFNYNVDDKSDRLKCLNNSMHAMHIIIARQ